MLSWSHRYLGYVVGFGELAVGDFAELGGCHAGCKFCEDHPAVVEIENGLLGDQAMDAARAGQRQRTLLENFGPTLLELAGIEVPERM